MCCCVPDVIRLGEKLSTLIQLGLHTCHLGVLLKEMGSVMRQYFCDDSSFLEIIVNKVGQFPTQLEIRFIHLTIFTDSAN